MTQWETYFDPEAEPDLDGEAVLAVQPRTYRNKTQRLVPEWSQLVGFGVCVHRVSDGGIYGSSHMSYVEDQVKAGFDAIDATLLPIVGYNLFGYSYRAIAAAAYREAGEGALADLPYDLSGIIPRSIDVMDIVRESVRAHSTSGELASMPHGALRLPVVLEHNETDVYAFDAAAPAEAAGELWYYLVDRGQVNVAGKTYEIPAEQMAILRGEAPRFASAGEWARAIALHGWLTDRKAPGYRYMQKTLERVYAPYL